MASLKPVTPSQLMATTLLGHIIDPYFPDYAARDEVPDVRNLSLDLVGEICSRLRLPVDEVVAEYSEELRLTMADDRQGAES